MKSPYDAVLEIIHASPAYDANDWAINSFMHDRWQDAFMAACTAVKAEYDEDTPLPVWQVAAEAEDAISDRDKFIADLKKAIGYYAK